MTSLLQKLTKQLNPLSDTPALDAQVLLAHITQKERAWVLAHPELALSPAQEKTLTKSLSQLKENVPLPYVIGHWEFFSLDFIVSPDVLIPRPETEELVERALSWLRAGNKKHVLDVGTGSGCIPIALARNAPNLNLLGVDISPSALNIALQNAAKHGVSDRIDFVESDLFSNIQPATHWAEPVEAFDLITANLPYIPTETLKNLDVYTREPSLALDGGADGLDLIRRLLKDVSRYIAPEGVMLLEIDSSHGEAALEIAEEFFPNAQDKLLQDLSGRDRFIRIQT